LNLVYLVFPSLPQHLKWSSGWTCRGRKNSAYEKQGERLCFPQIVGRIEGDQTQLIETDLAGLAGRGEGLSSAGDSLFGTGYSISGPLEAFNTPIDGEGKPVPVSYFLSG